jgi:hypothetical protein
MKGPVHFGKVNGAFLVFGEIMSFGVRDSGRREEYSGGFVRDVEGEKADLVWLFGHRSLDLLPREMVERWLRHMELGAEKYGRNNWELASDAIAVDRFKRSAARHFNQWLLGDQDEDHASATVFNIWAAEVIAQKLGNDDSSRTHGDV